MPGEPGFPNRSSPLLDVPTSRRARYRMVVRLWGTPALLALVVLALAACQPAPTLAPTTVPTLTPTLTSLPIPTPTPVPPPMPASVPSPEPTPTLTLAPSPEPTPTPTLVPSPVPTPTPPPSPSFSGLAGQIADIDYRLAQQVADYGWVADGVSDEEANALRRLLNIARKDSKVARQVAVRPWFIEGGDSDGWSRLAVLHEISLQDFRVVEQLMKDPWLIDDGPEDQWQTLGFLLGILSLDVNVPTVVIGNPLPHEPASSRQRSGLNFLREMAALDLGLVGTVVNRPWFKEGARAAQWNHIWPLSDIARRDIELAKTLTHYHWLIDGDAQIHSEVFGHVDTFVSKIDLELANKIVGAGWFVDGVTEDENQSLFDLQDVALQDLQLAKRLLNYPWVTDDLTASELRTFEFLSILTKSDPTMLQPVVDAPWFVDGVSDPEYVRLVLGLPLAAGDVISDISDTLRDYVLDSLTLVATVSSDSLRALGAQPWFADGLDNEEAAFVTAISRVPVDSPTLYQDLLDAHFTQSKTVSLPLSGDVNIWIFSDEPFKLGEDHRPLIEDTARILEDFLKVPFPTSDIILLAVSYTPYQFHAGSHIQVGKGDFIWSIPHEMAHYYFSGRTSWRWFSEGGADFISNLVYHRIGLREFPSSTTSKAQARQICGFENIRHLQYVKDSSWEWDIYEPYICFYSMGENFMHAVFETIGEEAMSSALREHFLGLDNNRHDFEQAIYRALLTHTPSDRKEDFQEIYRILHGGPYAYPDPPTSDDHGDEPEDATPVIVGDVVQGTLDYMFDFDYFRFEAREGQKYRMSVTHGALRATSLGLHSPDGAQALNHAWEYRERTEDGPEIVWEALRSGAYYFAVRNFGGETGTYTLTITLADN